MSSLSLAKKIASTVAMVLVFFGLLAGISLWAVSSLNGSFTKFSDTVGEGDVASDMTATSLHMQANISTYLNSRDASLVSEHSKLYKKLDDQFAASLSITEGEGRQNLEKARQIMKGYDGAFTQIVALRKKERELLTNTIEPGAAEIKAVLKQLLAADQAKGDIAGAFATSSALQSMFEADTSTNRFIVSFDKKDADEALATVGKLKGQLAQLKSDYDMGVEFDESLKDAKKEAALKSGIQASASYEQALGELSKALVEIKRINDEKLLPEGAAFATTMQRIQDGLSKTQADLNKEAKSTQATVNVSVWAISIAGAVIGFVFSWITVRGITRQIHSIVSRLESSSRETSHASRQVSSNSEALARDASEQAAAIEETSSSLEEVNAMTAKNAQNAESAKVLAREARIAAESGAESMKDMIIAMQEIKESSDNIANIIKTIDEIAFQTNILALNAAVEAARAGESGAGFAVVADEVRNLAHRSAEAASVTAQKIENSVEKSERGVELNQRVAENLQTIVEHTQKMDGLVAQISDASDEQNKGVGLIQKSITQMDSVTQRNAAGAEETASSSKVLLDQSTSLQSAIEDLVSIVNGGGPRQGRQSSIRRLDGSDYEAPAAPARQNRPSHHRGNARQVAPARTSAEDAFSDGWDN